MTQFRVNAEKLEIFFSSHEKECRERLLSAIHIVEFLLRLVGWLLVVIGPIKFLVHAWGGERLALRGSIFLRMLISQKPPLMLSSRLIGTDVLRHAHF